MAFKPGSERCSSLVVELGLSSSLANWQISVSLYVLCIIVHLYWTYEVEFGTLLLTDELTNIKGFDSKPVLCFRGLTHNNSSVNDCHRT